MRRTLIGAAAGVVLALTAAAGVSAYWQAKVQPIPSLSSGDLNVTAVWHDGAAWPAVAPGQTVSKHVRVTVNSKGTTLASNLFVTTTIAPAASAYVSIQQNLDDCTGSPGEGVPASGYPSSGSLADGQVLDICIRLTLSSSAPATLQGGDAAPTVVIRADQRSSPW